MHEVALRLTGVVERHSLVTVALSGGIDSIVLLDLARRIGTQIGFEVRALHVHHGLSPNADSWERFCRLHCARRHVRFQCVRIAVAGSGSNVEARARAGRYTAFGQYGTEIMLLAHHRDDQAETLLLRILRGAGARGLAAMPAFRALDAATGALPLQHIVRPLLDVSRIEIEQYAKRRRLTWIEDESNADERFARNYLRAQVLPMLERRFPGCARSLARSAEQWAESSQLLDELAAADLRRIAIAGKLKVRDLLALGAARAANALRYFLALHGAPLPSAARTREILRQIGSARDDRQPLVLTGKYEVRRHRGLIELVARPPGSPQEAQPIWQGEPRIILGDGGALRAVRRRGAGLSLARLRAATVTVRRRQGGEQMRLSACGRTRTLKNLLREAGIAPWERSTLPLLFCGDDLVWVPTIGCAAEYAAQAGEESVLFTWQRAEHSLAGN